MRLIWPLPVPWDSSLLTPKTRREHLEKKEENFGEKRRNKVKKEDKRNWMRKKEEVGKERRRGKLGEERRGNYEVK